MNSVDILLEFPAHMELAGLNAVMVELILLDTNSDVGLVNKIV